MPGASRRLVPMKTRTKKIQTRYTRCRSTAYSRLKIIPALDLSGEWFRAAGFRPGQLVSIAVTAGQIIITPQ